MAIYHIVKTNDFSRPEGEEPLVVVQGGEASGLEGQHVAGRKPTDLLKKQLTYYKLS